jgi:hypothetical protein
MPFKFYVDYVAILCLACLTYSSLIFSVSLCLFCLFVDCDLPLIQNVNSFSSRCTVRAAMNNKK